MLKEIKKKKGGRPTARPDENTLATLYASMTAREIAEQYHVSEYTVRGWINRARKQQEQAVMQLEH